MLADVNKSIGDEELFPQLLDLYINIDNNAVTLLPFITLNILGFIIPSLSTILKILLLFVDIIVWPESN